MVPRINNHVETFRDSLRSIDNERGKYQACLAMRNRLVDGHMELKLFFARMEEVMLKESVQYKKAMSHWPNPGSPNAFREQWEPFLDLAGSGADLMRECLAPLGKASMCWGNDKAQYYQWASMGWHYCKALGMAASSNPTWEDASIKLNQLLLNRIISQRPFKLSRNPIETIDLRCLGDWLDQNQFKETGHNGSWLQYQPVLRSDLPSDYTFDRYGLIIRKELSCPPEVITQLCTQTTTVSSLPVRSPKDQESRSLSIRLRSSATLSPKIYEDTGVCVNEDSIQSTLPTAMPSPVVTSQTLSRQSSTLYEEQPSPMSATAESQLLRETHDAAENSGCEDITSLMYEALTSVQFNDQNLTRHMAQLSQQYESLKMQLEMECIETSTQSIRSRLQNLDNEWLKRHRERRSLKKRYKRRCMVFLRDTNL